MLRNAAKTERERADAFAKYPGLARDHDEAKRRADWCDHRADEIERRMER